MKKLILLSFVFVIVSCETPVETPPLVIPEFGYIVVNEGVYGQNNSSITFYDVNTGLATNNVFSEANSGNPLGDTANDLDVFGSTAYIAVDNSNKIEIVDLNTYKSKGIIDMGPGGSPRELVVTSSKTGFVTSLLSNKVHKLDLINKSIVWSAETGAYPEGITQSAGKIFVANSGFGASNTLSVFDTLNGNKISDIQIGFNPRVLVNRNDGYIYAVCTGVYNGIGKGGVYKINTSTLVSVDSVLIDGNPGEACFTDSHLLVTNSLGVFRIEPDNLSIETEAIISASTVNPIYGIIYALAYDPVEKLILAGNPKDFIQNGEIIKFDLNGKKTGSFDTGLNPGTIAVYKKKF